jgi:hypothetical protein
VEALGACAMFCQWGAQLMLENSYH